MALGEISIFRIAHIYRPIALSRVCESESAGFFFRLTLAFTEGEDPADEAEPWQGGCSLAGPQASLIFVIALPETKDKADPG